MRRYCERETLPGPQVQSDDELLDFAKRNGTTTYHLIGTCRMGPKTDPTARWSTTGCGCTGCEGLRVVDASIMPTHDLGQYLRDDHDDRGEGLRHDPRSPPPEPVRLDA